MNSAVTSDSSSSEYESANSDFDWTENNCSLPSINNGDEAGPEKEMEDDSNRDGKQSADLPEAELSNTNSQKDTDDSKKNGLQEGETPRPGTRSWSQILEERRKFRSKRKSRPKPRPKPKSTCIQADRIIRRGQLVRRRFVQSQILRGRINPAIRWRPGKEGFIDNYILQPPWEYIIYNDYSELGLPVRDYLDTFAKTMCRQIFPGITETVAKAEKCRSLLSFVQSPPVESAFLRFWEWTDYGDFGFSDNMFAKELAAARFKFLDLMFGGRTLQHTTMVNDCIKFVEMDVIETWTLQDFILQFLVSVEIWRQHKTQRTESWRIGSRERVAEFLTAVLYNFHLMMLEGCFDTDLVESEDHWDSIWEEWLREYPVVEKHDGFVPREILDEGEDEILDKIGYLGGVGRYENHVPTRGKLGTHEKFMLEDGI